MINNMKVLVVESNDYKYGTLELLFRRFALTQIIRVKSVQEALNEFKKARHHRVPFNLIITDLILPVYVYELASTSPTGGFTLLRDLSKLQSETPIILYARNIPDDLQKGTETAVLYNIIETIPFPFDPVVSIDDFNEAIKSIKNKHPQKPKHPHGVAKFEKVSFAEFMSAMDNTFPGHNIRRHEMKRMYDNIKLPARATTGSAGYDFKAPFSFELCPGTEIMIPTGIRAIFKDPRWYLKLVPRSGCGVKTGIRLSNTEGIIDSDYFKADNEGHIMVKLEYPANPQPCSHLHKWGTDLSINHDSYYFRVGKGFVQGIFEMYGIVIDDDEYDKEDRWGGFGSTDWDNDNNEDITPDVPDVDIKPNPDDETTTDPESPEPGDNIGNLEIEIPGDYEEPSVTEEEKNDMDDLVTDISENIFDNAEV